MNATANHFAVANHLYTEVAERLLEHLAPITVNPQRILEMGAGCGTLLPGLIQQFNKAEIINLDFAEQRLATVESKGLFKKPISRVCADALQTPFANGHFDLIVANLLLHWLPDVKVWFTEVKRLLNDNGVLIFSYYGPDSLRELAKSSTTFHDMHDIGDQLIRCGLTHPILDSEHLTVEYDTVEDALNDLSANGEIALLDSPVSTQNQIDLTYEIVYGHAWKDPKPMTSKIDQDGMVRIEPSQILRNGK